MGDFMFFSPPAGAIPPPSNNSVIITSSSPPLGITSTSFVLLDGSSPVLPLEGKEAPNPASVTGSQPPNPPPSEGQGSSSILLEPLADFLLNLHRCVQGDIQFAELEKSIKTLSLSFKNADIDGRILLMTQMTNKETKAVPRLLTVIEHSNNDATLLAAVGELLHTLLSPLTKVNNRHQLMICLVQCNAGEVLFRALKSQPVIMFAKAELGVVQAFQVIAKLASKDVKLSIKCRLVGGISFIHQLIQASVKNNSLLQALLMVLKFIAKNVTNQVALGKEGCVSTLVSLLTTVPKTHWTKVKLILESLALLTKTKSNVIRLVRENGLAKIMSMLDSWEKIDKRHQTKTLKALLCILLHLCDSKHGRKAVVMLNGTDILHRLVLSCPSEPKFESLLSTALNVFLKCASKGELPVASLKGATTFQVPPRDNNATPSTECPSMGGDFDVETSDEEDDDEGGPLDLRDVDLVTVQNPQATPLDDLIKIGAFFTEFQNLHLGMNCSKKIEEPCASKGCEVYLELSSKVKSVNPFVKVAHPDMMRAEGPLQLEPLHQKSAKVFREKALRTVDRILNASNYQEKVIFDLDYLLETEFTTQSSLPIQNLSNWDEKRLGKKDAVGNHLNFESRFESGNLRRAIQVAPFEYDLLLNADVNSWHHHQWFYFEVSNMEAEIPYVLNIVNNEKPNSEFNFGMQPVVYSVRESQLGRGEWVRAGDNICYHKNHFVRVPQDHKGRRGRSYFTASFTLTFQHSYDVVYVAYHYPYTYTKLQTFLSSLKLLPMDADVYFLNQTLCHTLNSNPTPVLTITSNTKKSQDKHVVFLSARVHPGESNSSWMMEGVIRYLVGGSKESKQLRDWFVFKVVPMLNPEGVINGNQRCGLTDEDLNRRWRTPSASHHPTIYYTKAMIEHLTAVIGKKPLIFCDFHGHSRQKNVFMYGCSRMQSWWHSDKEISDPVDLLLVPRMCQNAMATFSLRDCRLHIERSKESTARVVVWRQFKVSNSFTIEASTCGLDQGPYKDHHLSPLLLLESGEGFCKAILRLKTEGTTGPVEQLELTGRTDNDVADWPEEINSDDELDFDIYGV